MPNFLSQFFITSQANHTASPAFIDAIIAFLMSSWGTFKEATGFPSLTDLKYFNSIFLPNGYLPLGSSIKSTLFSK